MKTLQVLTLCCLLGAPLAAQDVRARLESRGLPTDLVDQVSAIAADATARGLPGTAIADKAIEGFAKQIPGARIVAVIRQYGERMFDARTAVQGAGVAEPEGRLITAATDALGRGFAVDDIGRVVRAAPQPELAAPGLTVAAALAAQGIPTQVAASVVAQAMQRGSSASQILDLPSAARAMQSRGMSADDAGRQLLRDGAHAGGPGREGGVPGTEHGPGGLDRHSGSGGPGGEGDHPPPPRPGGGHGTDGRPGGTGGDHGGRPPRP